MSSVCKWRKCCSSFTDIIASEKNDSHCHFLSRQENGEPGAKPPEICFDEVFSMLGKHFHSYAEKGRSLDLQAPLVGLYKPTAFQM